ncbi:MAG: BMP family ABC transporter substrate-binding protein [Actinomycetota bacterium]
MRRNWKLLLALLALFSLIAAAGGGDDDDSGSASASEPADEPAEEPADEPAAEPAGDAGDFTACQVTDAGGIDDASFNQTAYKGITDAEDSLCITGEFLESQSDADYEPNINSFVEQGCDIIVTVGFLLGDATQAAATANPDIQFTIVDFAYDPAIDNVRGLVFDTKSASFLAGYVAAGTSETGVVGTFGGVNIPPVTDFMEGMRLGVAHYNSVNGTDVELLGWDGADGLFTGNFDSLEDGRAFGENLIAEGADVIMPVAGPVGQGTAAAAQEAGNTWIIGVDSDWYFSAPDFSDVILTSVLKNMDVAVLDSVENAVAGNDLGTLYVGTLDNGGVGIAPYYDVQGGVSQGDIDALAADLISGAVTVDGAALPEPDEPTVDGSDFTACQVTDAGGIDDASFNATAYKGITDAEDALGITGEFLESQSDADYEPNVNSFLEQGCDLIVTVGFLLGDATAAAAEANPDQQFAIVDFAYDPAFDNVRGLVFDTKSASFLAGYVAAGTTQTGVVGTFGGVNIPPVTDFMEGMRQGVAHYNDVNGTDVTLLGWDGADGLFTGNFDSLEDGRSFGENLIAEGADIIMPVAGPVGQGTAAAAQEAGDTWIIGVDSDWFFSNSDFADVILTSVLKNMDVAVFDSIENAVAGNDLGTLYVGTLDNGGVGIAEYHDVEGGVSPADIDALAAQLISGEVTVE